MRVSLLVFQQFLLLLVQSVFDKEYLRHFGVAEVAGSRTESRWRHKYAFHDREEKNLKKKLFIRKENRLFRP